MHRALADGSYLSVIYPSDKGRRAGAAEAIVVRVMEYELPGLAEAQPCYRLLTNLLDPATAPARAEPPKHHAAGAGCGHVDDALARTGAVRGQRCALPTDRAFAHMPTAFDHRG